MVSSSFSLLCLFQAFALRFLLLPLQAAIEALPDGGFASSKPQEHVNLLPEPFLRLWIWALA